MNQINLHHRLRSYWTAKMLSLSCKFKCKEENKFYGENLESVSSYHPSHTMGSSTIRWSRLDTISLSLSHASCVKMYLFWKKCQQCAHNKLTLKVQHYYTHFVIGIGGTILMSAHVLPKLLGNKQEATNSYVNWGKSKATIFIHSSFE